MAGSSSGAPPEAGPSRRLRWAFLGHPLVQAVRFATKAALAWFLTRAEMGACISSSLKLMSMPCRGWSQPTRHRLCSSDRHVTTS